MHAEEAELAELRDQLARQDSLLEPVADLRHHLLADELADRVADRLLLVVEEGVEREEVERIKASVRSVVVATRPTSYAAALVSDRVSRRRVD